MRLFVVFVVFFLSIRARDSSLVLSEVQVELGNGLGEGFTLIDIVGGLFHCIA